MSGTIEIPTCGALDASIRPPGSKSITNRALICAALAGGSSELRGALDSEDTQVLVAALGELGLQVDHDAASATIHVAGSGGRLPKQEAELFLANSGTSIRFLTAMLATCRGRFRLDGIQRMRERPIADLLAAIGQLGGHAISEAGSGCPPVVVEGTGIDGGSATVAGDISSQFLSGLLMAAPRATRDVELAVEGTLVSKPYITMTLEVIRAFGVDVQHEQLQRFLIPAGQTYRATAYQVEPDASAASYFWGAAAIAGGRVLVEGLHPDALQGDVGFCDCLRQMGCQVQGNEQGIEVRGGPLQGVELNMNEISDTVQTLAVVALFAEGPTTIRGVAHIRHKETDRIRDLARELRKLGAVIDEYDDGLRIEPRPLHSATLDTYNDHRMAMSLALAGLRVPGVVIRDPDCTQKTYPRYFEDLAKVTGQDATRRD